MRDLRERVFPSFPPPSSFRALPDLATTMAEAASFPPLLGYQPREYIASGGQSSIYRALHTQLKTFAALKVVPFPLHHQQELEAKAKQLVREMRIHETLKHKNILQLFGGETRESLKVRGTEWPMGLYMILDLGESLYPA